MATPKKPSDVIAVLKDYATNKTIEELVLHNHPFMDILQKDTNFQGKGEPLPLFTNPGVGVSGDFSTAQAGASNGGYESFQLTNGRLYGVIQFDDETLTASRSRMGSYVDYKRQELDGIFEYMGDQLANQLTGNGGGSIGTIDTIGGSPLTVVFNNPGDINNVEKGATYVASANDGSSTSHTLKAGEIVVTKVDRNAGSFVFTGSVSWAQNDHLFLKGTFGGATAANNTIPIKGTQSWFTTNPSSTTPFFAVDRSTESRLTGTLMIGAEASGSGLVRIRKCATKAHKHFRAKPRFALVTPEAFDAMAIELGNTGPSRDFTVKNDRGNYGYKALSIATTYGDIEVVADPYVRDGDGYLLDKKYLWLKSMEGIVHEMDKDELTMVRMASAAAYEIRYVSYSQFCTNNPAAHARLAMPTYA